MASGELRQIPEYISLEPELPEELLKPPELPEMQADVEEPETGLKTLEDEKSEPDRQAEEWDAPAALRKLRNSFTGDLHPVLPIRTRNGGQGGENENSVGARARVMITCSIQHAEGTDATGVTWHGRCETKLNLTRVSQGGSRDRPASGVDDADWSRELHTGRAHHPARG